MERELTRLRAYKPSYAMFTVYIVLFTSIVTALLQYCRINFPEDDNITFFGIVSGLILIFTATRGLLGYTNRFAQDGALPGVQQTGHDMVEPSWRYVYPSIANFAISSGISVYVRDRLNLGGSAYDAMATALSCFVLVGAALALLHCLAWLGAATKRRLDRR